jgi:hypothetical protein
MQYHGSDGFQVGPLPAAGHSANSPMLDVGRLFGPIIQAQTRSHASQQALSMGAEPGAQMFAMANRFQHSQQQPGSSNQTSSSGPASGGGSSSSSSSSSSSR